MKKKIAIFGNGWSEEYLKLVFTGIQAKAKSDNVDLYSFINYSSGPGEDADNLGEKSIFSLPDLTSFDGIILLTNTMNLPSEREYFHTEILKHHIPAVSLEYALEGIPCLCTDTYSGVFELTTHLITQHNVKHIVYISGPSHNQENLLRMQAVNDALSSIGKQLNPEEIIYGEWSYYTALTKLTKWLETNPLPDAFVCANDEMALGVFSALNSAGIVVPEHVIVTGCDCNDLSQKIYPMLSTVAREWDKLGYDSLDCVLRQINGETVTGTVTYRSVPVYGESCGCKVTDDRIQKRRRSIISNHKAQKEATIQEWHLRSIDDMLSKITNLRSLNDHLGWYFAANHSFEGNHFLVCLVENFSENQIHTAFTPQMDCLLHLKDGVAKAGCSFAAKDLLPPMELDSDTSNSFLFMPLHVEADILGYVVFINKLDIIYTQALYNWIRHVSQDLDRVRQNIRMEELNKMLTEVSMTDALTGLKNRTGYDALAVPLLQSCRRDGKTGAMIFADVNRMKLINDQYGHLQGDYALCTVAEAIKRTLPSKWVAVRFGGDEFIMVGECETPEQAEQIKAQLSKHLELLKAERELCFPLTASFGAVVIHPEESYTPEEYLRKADQAMYVMKQQAHNSTDSSN